MLTENQEQMTLYKWTQQPSVRRQYPELKYLFHIPNERHCDPRQGKNLKRMGVRSGVPDLFLPVPRMPYHGLWIEMKTETGHTSDTQDWWLDHLRAQGYACRVCHGWQAAADTLQRYLRLAVPEHG